MPEVVRMAPRIAQKLSSRVRWGRFSRAALSVGRPRIRRADRNLAPPQPNRDRTWCGSLKCLCIQRDTSSLLRLGLVKRAWTILLRNAVQVAGHAPPLRALV